MSDAYDRIVQRYIRSAFDRNITLQEGIYAGITGPSAKPLQSGGIAPSGGDAVGMSTVMEVIAAKQCGFQVAGLAISNKTDGGPDQQPDTIEEVLKFPLWPDEILTVLPALIQSWSKDPGINTDD